MGGLPPLGYDVQDRKLVVNPDRGEDRPADLRALCSIEVGSVATGGTRPNRLSSARCRKRGQSARPMAVSRLVAERSMPCCRTGSIAARSCTRVSRIPASMIRSSTRRCSTTFEQITGHQSGQPRTRHQCRYAVAARRASSSMPTATRMTPTHASKKGVRYRYYVSQDADRGEGGRG